MTYDVLVIGGRVAGASLALLLARKGHRVLMVDRDPFPSDTLSTHLLVPGAVARLGGLGLLDDVEAAGYRRIGRIRTWIDDCCIEGPIGPQGSYSLAPRRSVLDGLLVDRAVRAGAEFRERTSAEALVEEGGHVVGAVLRSPAGARGELRARVVVGADGRHSKVADWTRAARYHVVPPLRPVYYGYYRGLEPVPEPAVELWFARGEMGFVFPMRPGEDCIALEIPPEDFETFRSHPQAAFEARVRTLYGMGRRMLTATLEGRILGTKGVENQFRKPYGAGWALTGDAGYLKDPSTGLGIGDALTQSTMLAEALDAYLSGADWEESLSGFHRRRDQLVMPDYGLTLSHTKRRDLSSGELAWVKAVVSVPPWLRMFVNAMPGLLEQVYSPDTLRGLREVAGSFDPDVDAGPGDR
jgi:flavin-dependent dehydrogenase